MNIAIFASGEGTNAESIINHFKLTDVKITLVCNKSNLISFPNFIHKIFHFLLFKVYVIILLK